jgi:hypothetical protein
MDEWLYWWLVEKQLTLLAQRDGRLLGGRPARQ